MGVNDAPPATTREVVMAILAYSTCSSLMLVTNKVAVYYVPIPALVTFLQLIAAVGFVLMLKTLALARVDDLEWSKIQPYLVYIAAFAGGIYCNMKALQGANVETVIVFRSCTPLAVSMLDAMFLGREYPSARSLGALLLILVGAAGYVLTDKAFQIDGLAAYFWVSLYFVLICFEMTYGKKIISTVQMESIWGPVLYTNVLALVPMAVLGFAMQEQQALGSFALTSRAVLVLALSCAIGIGISFSGWNCRSKVSATSYTLVGVMNKLITILVNCLLWDNHASAYGITALMICIAGGTLYRQAPMRKTTSVPLGP